MKIGSCCHCGKPRHFNVKSRHKRKPPKANGKILENLGIKKFTDMLYRKR